MCVIRKFWWHCDKHFIYCTRKKGPAGRNSGFLLPEKLKNCILNEKLNPFFFLSGFFFRDTDNSQDSRGREGTIFYSTLPLPPAHEHSDIYLQLCMWDDYHIFLIAPLVFTRLLLDEIYHLIELLFDWLMMWCWFSFVYLMIWV